MWNEAKLEWDAWRKVATLLEASGAVTMEDSQSGLGSSGTPGLELYSAIKDWGDLLVDLRGAKTPDN